MLYIQSLFESSLLICRGWGNIPGSSLRFLSGYKKMYPSLKRDSTIMKIMNSNQTSKLRLTVEFMKIW